MPATVKEAIKNGVPMVMLEKTNGDAAIISYVEYELIMMTSMLNMNPGLLLQKHQVPIVARELYENFKNESLEDFSIAFKRGAMGFYNPEGLFRVDGAVVTQWVQRYLEEKYTQIEGDITEKKKDDTKEEVEHKIDYAELVKRREREIQAQEDKKKKTYEDVHKEAEYMKVKAKLEAGRPKFICDGIEVSAVSEEWAIKSFKQMFGHEPTSVLPKESGTDKQ